MLEYVLEESWLKMLFLFQNVPVDNAAVCVLVVGCSCYDTLAKVKHRYYIMLSASLLLS